MRRRRLGLIGGTSWESTLEYYRLINRRSGELLGGNHTAELLLWSLDFGEVLDLKSRQDPKLAEMFFAAARGVASLGAELLVICSNTGHQRAEALKTAAGIPLVHIADACGSEIRRRGFDRVGLLGTLDTMQGTFYTKRLLDFGIDTVVPEASDQARVHEIAIDEISRGIRLERSRKELIRIVEDLRETGAKAVILGCTELPLLVSQSDTDTPLLDTLSLHVDAIVRAMMDE